MYEHCIRCSCIYQKKVWNPLRSCFPALYPFTCSSACDRIGYILFGTHAVSDFKESWRWRAFWFSLFIMEKLGERIQRGWWRDMGAKAAFCWETVRPCKELTVCVWGESSKWDSSFICFLFVFVCFNYMLFNSSNSREDNIKINRILSRLFLNRSLSHTW